MRLHVGVSGLRLRQKERLISARSSARKGGGHQVGRRTSELSARSSLDEPPTPLSGVRGYSHPLRSSVLALREVELE